MIILKTGDTFAPSSSKNSICIVQFGSQSCLPCVALHSKLDQWLSNHPKVFGIYVPIEKFPELAASHGIFTVPSILVFVEGKKTLQESGYFSLDSLLTKIQRYVDFFDGICS